MYSSTRSIRRHCAAALLVALAAGSAAFAQQTGGAQQNPAQGPQVAGTPTQPPQQVQFPPVNEANFTSDTPTRETVEAFLKASWGYDPNRVWEVYAIQKTAAPGVIKVMVLVAEKQNPQQIANLTFYVTPDGKHLIANEVLPFGANPYAENRALLQQDANGPSRGAAGKQFELVEFADFQCPHCKAAQPIVEKLVQDFPQAHFVFENFPLSSLHSEAEKAAAYGVCVAQQGGNDAFFKYADAVFTNQQDLTPSGSAQALSDAVTKAGLDPAKISTCASSPSAKSAVDASVKLAHELDVNETPFLFIDGRGMPLGAVPYEQLKQIVNYQFGMDK